MRSLIVVFILFAGQQATGQREEIVSEDVNYLWMKGNESIAQTSGSVCSECCPSIGGKVSCNTYWPEDGWTHQDCLELYWLNKEVGNGCTVTFPP